MVGAHYFIGYGEEGGYDPKAGKAFVITDGTRYRILITGNGPQYPDMRELMVFDGHRLFVDESDSAPRYLLYDAPHQHPHAQFYGSALIYDPKMAPWNTACGHTAPTPKSTGTILGRSAQNYRCTGKTNTPSIWVDKATHLVLKVGPLKARNLTVNPPITPKTFSTQPPEGTHVHVIPAQ